MVTSPSTVQRLNLAKYLKSYKFCIYKVFQTFCGCKENHNGNGEGENGRGKGRASFFSRKSCKHEKPQNRCYLQYVLHN